MHVLITRPGPEAADLASRIAAAGCQVTQAPLIEAKLNAIPLNAIPGATVSRRDAVVATSRNGLRALAQSPCFEHAVTLPLFAVGPATAALARDLGFNVVITGAGTAADLVPLITAHSSGQPARVYHLAGDHLAFDLGTALNASGVNYTRIDAYRTVAAKTLDAAVRKHLEDRSLDAVILMSPRTAQTWATLVRALPVAPDLTCVAHICLSAAVARALEPLGPVKCEISAAPNATEIVALVYRLAGSAKTG